MAYAKEWIYDKMKCGLNTKFIIKIIIVLCIYILFMNTGIIYCMESTAVKSINVNNNLGQLVKTNLYFRDIGFYEYNYSRDMLRSPGGGKLLRLFWSFKRHPLISWNLELVGTKQTILFDYITNTSKKSKMASFIHNNNMFVNDPSMLYGNNEFLAHFTKNKTNLDFTNTKNSINLYKELLMKIVHENNYNEGIFTQNIVEKNLIEINLNKKLY